jgi:hypothetical protein
MERLFWACHGRYGCFFWQAFPKTNKEIRVNYSIADRYAAPTAQYGYGIPDLALTLSGILIKIILWFIHNF